MDISDIPDLPIPSISSSQENPRRRRRGTERRNREREGLGPTPRQRPPERSVELLLSDEARIYQALRDVAERALRNQFDDESDRDRANSRLDEWHDWTPDGAAKALFRELRAQRPVVQDVRTAFRDELDSHQRGGTANPAIEAHLRETLFVLLTYISGESEEERTDTQT